MLVKSALVHLPNIREIIVLDEGIVEKYDRFHKFVEKSYYADFILNHVEMHIAFNNGKSYVTIIVL